MVGVDGRGDGAIMVVTPSEPVEANGVVRTRVRAAGKPLEDDNRHTHTFPPLYEDRYYYFVSPARSYYDQTGLFVGWFVGSFVMLLVIFRKLKVRFCAKFHGT